MKQRDYFWAGTVAGLIVGGIGWVITRRWGRVHEENEPLRVGAPFPRMTGNTLTGASLTLPDHLAGSVSLLIIGFDYDARDEMTEWARHVTERYGEQPNLHIFQVAAMGGVAPYVRAMLDAAMARSTPEWARQQIVTLYGDLRTLRWRMEVCDQKQAHLVLLGRTGRVAWRTSGPLTAEREAALDSALAAQDVVVHWKHA